MSTVSESQPWWAIVSAEKLFGIASQPLTAAPPDFQRRRSLFSRMVCSMSVESDLASVDGDLLVLDHLLVPPSIGIDQRLELRRGGPCGNGTELDQLQF